MSPICLLVTALAIDEYSEILVLFNHSLNCFLTLGLLSFVKPFHFSALVTLSKAFIANLISVFCEAPALAFSISIDAVLISSNKVLLSSIATCSLCISSITFPTAAKPCPLCVARDIGKARAPVCVTCLSLTLL